MATRKKAATTSKRPAGAARGRAGVPAPEAIAARAYSLFIERGSAHGHDWDDWLQAERELVSAAPPEGGTDADQR